MLLPAEVRRHACAAAVLAALVSLPGCATPLIFGHPQPDATRASEQRPRVPAEATVQRSQSTGVQPGGQRPATSLSSATSHLARSVQQSGDNQQLPFLIIDKVTASVAAFDGQGRLLGVSPALLGSARGDHSVPGIGDRPIAKILSHE